MFDSYLSGVLMKNKMSNNDILKKLRVALQLRDDDIVKILALVDFKITKTELSSFFRAEDHPNYRSCGDSSLKIKQKLTSEGF